MTDTDSKLNAPANQADALHVLHQLRQRFQNCRELAGFEEPSELFARGDAAITAVAGLVEAGKRTDAAIMAWRMSGKPDLGELNAAHGDLIAALAHFGGAS